MQFNFTGWLYRPYIDLGPCSKKAPLHVFGIELEYLNLMEQAKLPRINSILMPSFRETVLSQSGLQNYNITNPINLEVHLQTNRWISLCEKIRRFEEINSEERSYILRILNKMCFYDMTLTFTDCINTPNNSIEAEIIFQIALAKSIKNLEGNLNNNSIDEFKRLVEQAPIASQAKINSLYQIAIHCIKKEYNRNAAAFFINMQKNEITKAKNALDDFTFHQFMSRLHRVNAFIPQMDNDKVGVAEEMNFAEWYAQKLIEIAKTKTEYTEQYEIAALEMLYPVLESRSKEALWLQNLPLAESYAKKLITICPSDPRARLNLGQILLEQQKVEEALIHYKVASLYGPPGTEIAWFMLGQCYEALENFNEAANSYLMSLHYDPLGISSRDALLRISKNTVLVNNNDSLSTWVNDLVHEFNLLEDNSNPIKDVQPYQGRQFDEIANRPKNHQSTI